MLLLATALPPGVSRADAGDSRASVGGYFRVMARPDLQGGDGRLGYWNLYGRLLNEGPWAALELKLDLIPPDPGSGKVWTAVHFKLEGGSVLGADPGNGKLNAFGLTQLYVEAGNVLFPDVTWQLGTLDTWMGDLGLYDMKPAQIFYGTVGVSATLRKKHLDLTVGVGDSGFFLLGSHYSPVLTGGVLARIRVVRGLEIGGGGQFQMEPSVPDNPNAPHTTPGIRYQDFVRGEVVQHYLTQYPGQEDQFYKNLPPQASSAAAWKLVGYVGFGGFGPITWDSLYANYQKLLPLQTTTETYQGRTYTLYVKGLTDERYQVNVGNEMQLSIVPGTLDAVWGLLYGRDWNLDNKIAAGEDNREFYSTVLRLQLYLTKTVHVLLENSLAREISLNGDLFRASYDSVFKSTGGQADTRGLAFGDLNHRDTWQLKVGPVFNPEGLGIFTRPSLRLLFGLQRSNTDEAFGSSVVKSLADYNQLNVQRTHNQYWHTVVSLEAEAWF